MSARPELVLFDAVGTLIYPDPPAIDVYFAASQEIRGYDISRGEISLRFQEALKQSYLLQATDRKGETNEIFEMERWLAIVRSVFREVDEVRTTMLFNGLWQKFAEPAAWRVFPDVAETVAELNRRGYRTGIASNFDQRLLKICRDKEELATLDPIFVSSGLGWSKPALEFYRAIERSTQLSPERILIVGDDFEKDVEVPRHYGWQARWLVRTLASQNDHIHTLTELLDQLPG